MTATIHEAKTHLSRLIKMALEGEEIVIAKDKRVVVKLTPIAGKGVESWATASIFCQSAFR